jgi:putative ABC transport system substrate-binding protein
MQPQILAGKLSRRALVGGLACTAVGLATTGCGAVQLGTPRQTRRVAVLSSTSRESSPRWWAAFEQGLGDLGWIAGQNLVLEWRFGDGRQERAPVLAAEILSTRPEVILASSSAAALAVQHATTAIPIVALSTSDPLALGLVDSLAHPTGNITVLTQSAPQLATKRLELLKDILPNLSRVAMLTNPVNPLTRSTVSELHDAAKPLGLLIKEIELSTAGGLGRAFDSVAAWGAEALVQVTDALLNTLRSQIVEVAAQQRLPATYATREWVDVGGLMAYGPSYPAIFRRAASYVDRILRGSQVTELPVEQPREFEFLVNLTTAEGLGLCLSSDVSRQVTEWVQ